MLVTRHGRFLGAAALLLLWTGCASPDPAEREQRTPDAKEERDSTQAPAAKPQDPPEGDRVGGPPGDGPLDELAKELSLRDQERAALSRHYFEIGKRFYEQFDYAKAAENFQKAVDATPNDGTVRHYLLMAQLLAGNRQAEFKTVAEVLAQEKNVSIQQEREALARLYDEGKAHMEAGQYDRAIVRFEQVLEKVRWFPYPIDTGGYEDSARKFIVEARSLQRKRELQEQEEREARALAQADAERRRYESERKRAVDMLLRRALDQIALHQYKAAEGTIAEILDKDPENDQAHKLRDLAIQGRHIKREERTYDEDEYNTAIDTLNTEELGVPYLPETVMFPDRETWLIKVQSREQGIADVEDSEPQWVRDYKQILSSRTVTLNFPDTPFAEVVSFLQDITGLNITIGASVDPEETTVQLRLREILLEDALKIILEQTGLAMAFRNETLLITQPEEARGDYLLDIYDVQDLLARIPDFPGDRIKVAGDSSSGGGGGGGAGGGFTFEDEEDGEGSVIDPDQLEQIITNSVGEDNWDDPATIEIHRGQVIINQTREMHAQIRHVLENLRRNTGLFVQVETRFVRMTDDFLRDIGIDLRGLGRSATPQFGFPMELDPNPNTSGSNQGTDMGFGRQIPSGGGRASRIGVVPPGSPAGTPPFFGTNMFGGRSQNILNGGDGYFAGERLNGTSVSAGLPHKGIALAATLLDPFQLSAILRAEQEKGRRKLVDAPVVTAANRQRVSVSVITQRAYISDYELSSGGTGLVVAEVADPIIETFQEGVVLDVRPTISSDRKYITLDVRPTLATLVNGSFRQIPVNLGTISNAAINVNIEVPEVTLQEVFTSVTLPDGGTALLGGFRKINNKEERSGVPLIDRIPILNLLFSRQAELYETESMLILVTARTIALRDEEKKRFNLKND